MLQLFFAVLSLLATNTHGHGQQGISLLPLIPRELDVHPERWGSGISCQNDKMQKNFLFPQLVQWCLLISEQRKRHEKSHFLRGLASDQGRKHLDQVFLKKPQSRKIKCYAKHSVQTSSIYWLPAQVSMGWKGKAQQTLIALQMSCFNYSFLGALSWWSVPLCKRSFFRMWDVV